MVDAAQRELARPDLTSPMFIIVNIWQVLSCCFDTHSSLFIQMNIRAIGEVIRARREVLGIDQRTLSEISGVAVHTLRNIESANGNPTVKSLNKVLHSLGMELRVEVQE